MEYKKEMIHYTAVDEALVTIADAEKWYIRMFSVKFNFNCTFLMTAKIYYFSNVSISWKYMERCIHNSTPPPPLEETVFTIDLK